MLKNRIIGIFLLLLLLASCRQKEEVICYGTCLLYTSDAADD